MKIQSLLTALLLATSSAFPAVGGGFSDLVMAPGVLTELPQDQPLRYDHQRRLPLAPDSKGLPGAHHGIRPLEPVTDAVVQLSAEAGEKGPQLRLSTLQDDEKRDLAHFHAAGPNPVLLFFLENVMRNMALQTGGSPHYIRNAIRKDLSLAQPQSAGNGRMQVVLHPFLQDENAARMGDYQNLALTIIWPQAHPEQVLLLQASTGDAPGDYLETLTLVEE